MRLRTHNKVDRLMLTLGETGFFVLPKPPPKQNKWPVSSLSLKPKRTLINVTITHKKPK